MGGIPTLNGNIPQHGRRSFSSSPATESLLAEPKCYFSTILITILDFNEDHRVPLVKTDYLSGLLICHSLQTTYPISLIQHSINFRTSSCDEHDWLRKCHRSSELALP